MRKVILRAVAIAVAEAVGLFLIIVGILTLARPRALAGVCENFGWYSLAADFTSMQYSSSGDLEDMCRAVDYSVRAEDNGKVIKYSEKIFGSENFEEFYAANAYRVQNYYIIYADALYDEGRADDAVKVASDALERGVNVPGALGALAVLVGENGDSATAGKLLEILNEKVDFNDLNEIQLKYYDAVRKVLTGLGD